MRSDQKLLALAEEGTGGLSAEQLVLAFALAIEQAAPAADSAVCLSLRPSNDAADLNPPLTLREQVGARLGQTAYPASECGFDTTPFLIASGKRAILYTVRVRSRQTDGSATILASAVYGNLGAQSRGYRLVRKAGAWSAEPTGEWIVS